MASTYNSLGWGLNSQKEIEAGLRRREHQILATRQVVGDKGPVSSALEKRIRTKKESSKPSKVFIKRKRGQDLWMDTQADSEFPSHTLAVV